VCLDIPCYRFVLKGLSHRGLCDQSAMFIVLSAYQEKIPARNAIYAHAQDFSAGDELLLAIMKFKSLNKASFIFETTKVPTKIYILSCTLISFKINAPHTYNLGRSRFFKDRSVIGYRYIHITRPPRGRTASLGGPTIWESLP
jgi:hypothetical protein